MLLLQALLKLRLSYRRDALAASVAASEVEAARELELRRDIGALPEFAGHEGRSTGGRSKDKAGGSVQKRKAATVNDKADVQTPKRQKETDGPPRFLTSQSTHPGCTDRNTWKLFRGGTCFWLFLQALSVLYPSCQVSINIAQLSNGVSSDHGFKGLGDQSITQPLKLLVVPQGVFWAESIAAVAGLGKTPD